MNLLIVGGFLGSGKTSLVGQIAKYIAFQSKNPQQIEVVIIENEIGEVGIDQKVLQVTGFEVINLFAGCACCTLSGDIADTLNSLKKEIQPKWVILELSGVSIPDNIKKITEKIQINSRSCVLIDVYRWERIKIPLKSLLLGQLNNADLILLNKTDLISEEVLQLIEESIEKDYKSSAIIKTNLCNPLDNETIKLILSSSDNI